MEKDGEIIVEGWRHSTVNYRGKEIEGTNDKERKLVRWKHKGNDRYRRG